MGYSHGIKWTDDKIKQEILSVMKALDISRLPTKSECDFVTESTALSNAISKRFGWYKLAEMMGLSIRECETTTGKEFEEVAKNILSEKGFVVERMVQNHPFDLLVNGTVKIDVKASNLYNGTNGDYYSYNLGYKNHSCDFFMLLELNNEEVIKVMIVPSVDVMNIKQISVGVVDSKYHKYTDCYHFITNLSNYWLKDRKDRIYGRADQSQY